MSLRRVFGLFSAAYAIAFLLMAAGTLAALLFYLPLARKDERRKR